MEIIHGGDIYRNHVTLDFSVNVNPLGIPKQVERALMDAVMACVRYPDPEAQELKTATASVLKIEKEQLIFGNGASELFMAVVHAVRPRRTVIPVPSFYGYEYAAGALEQEMIYYPMKEQNGFRLDEDILGVLTEDTDLLFLANPNNPVGNLIEQDVLRKILKHCKERQITVVLDECFIEFADEKASMLSEINAYGNLLIVRAFTKIFAIPGVRIGYLMGSDRELLAKIKRQLPEWNLSAFAQAAGVACAGEREYIEKTKAYVKTEAKYLLGGLREAGICVFPTKADFLLFYSRLPLYDRLLEQGILIRDCSNFRGLSKSYYRIAVKSRAENKVLLDRIGELIWTE